MSGKPPEPVDTSAQELQYASAVSELWTEYKKKYKPLEQTWQRQVKEFGSPSALQAARSSAESQAYASSLQQANAAKSSLALSSGGPSSGRFTSGLGSVYGMTNVIKSDAASQGEFGQRTRQFGGLESLVDIGQSHRERYLGNLGTIAGKAAGYNLTKAQVNTAAQRQREQTAISTGVGAGAGVGAGIGAAYGFSTGGPVGALIGAAIGAGVGAGVGGGVGYGASQA